MVLLQKSGQVIDIEYICFIQADDGAIFMGLSRAPANLLLSFQIGNHHTLQLKAQRPGCGADLRALREQLHHHCIRGDWYAPSPEVMAHVYGERTAPAAQGGGRRLSQAEVLEIFRLWHGSGVSQKMLALRYGVSVVSVSRIARGAVYAHLFKRTPCEAGGGGGETGATAGDFYISENRPDAPRYRMTPGKRGTR